MTEHTAPADGGASTGRRASRGSAGRGVLLFLRDVVVIVAAALVISFLIKTFLIRSFYIPSESMESTLLVNDRIIVNQLVPEVMPLERGDIVVFRDPGGWLTAVPTTPRTPLEEAIDGVLTFVGLSAGDSDEHLIKRVIGLPGDRITCCNDLGQLSINGVPLDEPYVLLPPDRVAVSGQDFQEDVPEGTLWVMGDNRYDSSDSRINGVVPIADVVGRAVVISWPFNRWQWLDNYPLVFDGVERAE
ncbi:signal peptidase I [Microcella frigidaquae]|uniref:Signal peptidase I n=1 Tax=Microcella frigidaquae TaxID=424758 RepID=A0A840X4M8_9MICO|nr:signal peptidase I [Microcella frigidaquae]MBB5617340.1 signal peptidase I [Microcella frigidaquae]NHN45186.1 signal peptidase I [Microcella frigidaquae]